MDPLELTNQVYNADYQNQLISYRYKLDSLRSALGDTVSHDTGKCHETLAIQREAANQSSSEFFVSPNPANEFLLLSLSENKKYSCADLINNNGVVVQHIKFTDSNLSVNMQVKKLAAGIYLLVLRGDKEISTRKIIIIH